MTFLSFAFLIFFAACMLVYFLVPKKFQWLILLIFSYIFYFFASGKLPAYMLVTTVITYLSTRLMYSVGRKSDEYLKANKSALEKDERKRLKSAARNRMKAILIVGLVINFGLLAVFKYTDFLVSNFIDIANAFGADMKGLSFNLMLPLGISFYTFQSTGYMIDVYRKKVVPEKNFLKTALFVSYFPQIIEGPIGRFDALAPQLYAKHSFNFVRFKENIILVLWGFLKKMVIADNLIITVNFVCESYDVFNGFNILFSMLLYGIVLYTDFSGYMDMATGFSGILGIELAENFRRPYFSTSLAEFWRRWHISLCSWFRDYLFYSMYLSKPLTKMGKALRKKKLSPEVAQIPMYIAMAVVWFITGLWHGACWTEIIWGFANGLIMIFSLAMKNVYAKTNTLLHINTQSKAWKVFSIIRTYILVTALNFICNFGTFTDSYRSFRQMFTVKFLPSLSQLNLSFLFPKLIFNGAVYVYAAIFACALLFAVSLYQEKKGSVIKLICSKHWIVQAFVMLFLLYFVVQFHGVSSDMTGGFMYAQF